jgi:hypothetical protein
LRLGAALVSIGCHVAGADADEVSAATRCTSAISARHLTRRGIRHAIVVDERVVATG